MNYFEEIKKALLARGAKGNVTKSTDFNSIGLDSLDLMDMIVTLEEEIGITISDDQLLQIKTVEDLLNIIDELKAA